MERHGPSNNRPPQKNHKPPSQVRSLGPVPNLEEHVHAEWWRQIFNSTYLKTDGDVVDDQQVTSKEVDTFCEIVGLQPDDRILDLCCGQGPDSLELVRRGFQNVEGLDRSHYLIQRARAQAKKEGLNVKFKEGDARKLPYASDSFDVVMILGNSFGYFETDRGRHAGAERGLPRPQALGQDADRRGRRRLPAAQIPAAVVGVDRQELLRLPRALAVAGQAAADLARSRHARGKGRDRRPVLRGAAL